MADVFLSYAKEDRARARAVAATLESCGFSVFWDVKIREGSDWRRELERELGKARAMVVVWSESSGTSHWVKEEAEIGRQREILVPVVVDKVTPPLGFGTLQAIDLAGWRGGRAEGIDRLVRAVSKTLRRPPRRGWRPPPRPRSWGVSAASALCLTALAAYLTAWWLPRPPIMNQEIVIDASEGMGAPFEGKTKLQAAVDALSTRTLHSSHSLALRAFGGECGPDPGSDLLVSFGTGRGERILEAAKGMQPRGRPTLVSGVISALDDFDRLEYSNLASRVRSALGYSRRVENTKRLVVLTGHADQCSKEAVREIQEEIDAYRNAGHTIKFELRFIGVGVSEQDQAQIRAVSDSVGGQAYFVQTLAKLDEALKFVLEVEPARSHAEAVFEIINAIAQSLTSVATSLNQKKFDEVERLLDAAREAHARQTASFEALSGKQVSVSFEKFYELGVKNRSLQEQLFASGAECISQGRASGESQSPEYAKAIEKWNDLALRYNSNAGEMSRLTETILEEALNSAASINAGGRGVGTAR